MYYDRLRQTVKAYTKARQQMNAPRSSVIEHIAPCFVPVHDDITAGAHMIYNLPGGRGSGKSSFVSLEIVDGIMNDPTANAIVFRRYANTMRESVYSQIQWAIDELGCSALWRGSISPMVFTYLPTGQAIYFRGLDDPGKLKSIKPRHGRFAFCWFEEFSELSGPNMVRSVLQSVVRGGDGFRIFNSFNPPISRANWANKYVLNPDARALLFRSTYKDIPPEWLGEAFILEAERLQEVNERAYLHEYMGEPTGSGGEVFPNLEAREITDDEIQQMQYFYAGLDFGFSVDPCAFIVVAYDRKRQTVYLLDEIVKRGLTNSQLAEAIRAKGYTKPGYVSAFEPAFTASSEPGVYRASNRTAAPRPAMIICDSAEPKSIQDLRNAGLNAIPCKKYPGSVNYGIRWLQGKYIVIDPKRCPHSWEEFSSYEYMTTKDGEFLADVPDKNNHCIDGCRYSLDRLINDRRESA